MCYVYTAVLRLSKVICQRLENTDDEKDYDTITNNYLIAYNNASGVSL